MFNLKQDEVNVKSFYLKDIYRAEESFKYNFTFQNHISKTGFTLCLTDTSPWVSGITNQTELIMNDKIIFNSGTSNYINAFNDYSFVFNNIIQLSGINYQFYPDSSLKDTKTTKLGDYYVIVFDDNEGKIVFVDLDGNVLTTETFCDNPISSIEIISINDIYMVVGYYDTILNNSYLIKLKYENGVFSKYSSFVYYLGYTDNLRINKVSETLFIITYHTQHKGIIQMAKLSDDSSFSMGFPFIFNDDITLFSDSVYQNDNVLVLYYDIDDQLKIKNCRLYYNNDYIGVGLPKILKEMYCYDLNIGKLDDNYVYISYYDASNIKIYSSLLKIDNDITLIDEDISVDDWNIGLDLTTINDKKYIISYMDDEFVGVYREIDLSGDTIDEIECDYNEFIIDLSTFDLRKFIGHNDYTIKYNNEIVEKGVCFIEPDSVSYNI